MTLAEKQRELISTLLHIKDGTQRFAWVVQRARRQPSLDAEFKTDANRIEGCLSKLWLTREFRQGRCFFQADSDSLIVKGIAGLLCEFYSDHTPEEILPVEPLFLGEAGITQHLTPNRRNGLARLWEHIRTFAAGHREQAAA